MCRWWGELKCVCSTDLLLYNPHSCMSVLAQGRVQQKDLFECRVLHDMKWKKKNLQCFSRIEGEKESRETNL